MSFFKRFFGMSGQGRVRNPHDIAEQNKFLETVRYGEVDFFNLKGYKTWAKCVKIYDGDSCTLVFFYNNRPYKFRIRLAEIDTPELKSDNPVEVKCANQARDMLVNLIDDKLVYVECLDWDKYGRLLARLFPNNITQQSFNKVLVENGLAYEYDGGTKKNFSEWYQGADPMASSVLDVPYKFNQED